jgi:2-polyprenyl-3-methyl-5-hydroxy-6-metoxy-1,4-benzoquinol methylase
MTLENEIEMYDGAEVSDDTGEIELWDKVIFPNIIRKREMNIIFNVIASVKPRTILDLGCGGGWLSKILSARGYHTIGIDISASLIKTATKAAPKSVSFLIGDCMNLPFNNNTFDLIIGMGVLHHLDLDKTLTECHRVLSKNGSMLIMEPNALNPLMAIGRRLVPIGICTKDEKPFVPGTLKNEMVESNFKIQSIEYLFPYSFGVAYISGKIESKTYRKFIKIMLPVIEGSEKVIENIPFIRKMNSTIVVVGAR